LLHRVAERQQAQNLRFAVAQKAPRGVDLRCGVVGKAGSGGSPPRVVSRDRWPRGDRADRANQVGCRGALQKRPSILAVDPTNAMLESQCLPCLERAPNGHGIIAKLDLEQVLQSQAGAQHVVGKLRLVERRLEARARVRRHGFDVQLAPEHVLQRDETLCV
jgi:hypothetical protein